MKITLDLTEEEIKALHNAVAVFGHEVSAMCLGCESWIGDQAAKLYPDVHPFDREEMMSNQVLLAKKLVISIEQKENEKS